MSAVSDTLPPPNGASPRWSFRTFLSKLVPDSVDKARLWLELPTLGVLIIVAAIYYGQLKNMQRTLDMAERAWILASIVGPVLEAEGGSVVQST